MSSQRTPETVPRRTLHRHDLNPRRFGAAVLAGVVAVLLVVAGAAGWPSGASAADNPYQRGPAPTAASIAADRGPFATAQVTVPRGNGFGGGVIYYPTDTSQGTFGAIAIAPGFNTAWSYYAWQGPRLASFGFVVIGIETNTLNDYADARAAQLLAALDYLVNSSSVRDRVDRNRLAVGGHSMGGGGAILAAGQRPSLLTAVGQAPYVPDGSLTGIKSPTIIFAGQADGTVTPQYAQNAYNTIPSGVERAYVEIANEGHGFPAGGGGGNSGAFARTMMVWLKLFVDKDTRYAPFLCPSLTNANGISKYMASCPLDPPGGGPTSTPTTSPTSTPSSTPTGTPPAGGTSALRGVASGRCLDVNGASQSNGATVLIWDCNGQNNQKWTSTSASELRVYGNKCLDVNGGGTADGTAVIIWDCNGQNNQKWRFNSDGSITAVGANKCLDVSGSGTANGTKVQIWSCTGQSNQKWTRV
ncbi:ricin-type beta-trefoil lectin domain protein [Microbispora cellulosiformans]|uniref:Poly(ethylene terephthalate) hydrolase n=1 Tax=Microbispora cellulosiformans TaxID=2614688 RepID=A0A5J5K6L1_9ACTN|nr:RICIN domain-containing protein [Microbispora cellulosiformans]KAA9380375.1 ricin-type beta-trefoil lectin domain protein [Microbispora cellulosiformans]